MFDDCEEYIHRNKRKLVYHFYVNSADYLQLLVRYLLSCSLRRFNMMCDNLIEVLSSDHRI